MVNAVTHDEEIIAQMTEGLLHITMISSLVKMFVFFFSFLYFSVGPRWRTNEDSNYTWLGRIVYTTQRHKRHPGFSIAHHQWLFIARILFYWSVGSWKLRFAEHYLKSDHSPPMIRSSHCIIPLDVIPWHHRPVTSPHFSRLVVWSSSLAV